MDSESGTLLESHVGRQRAICASGSRLGGPMTIEVIPEDLRRAGRQMSDVADVVGDAKPGEGLKDLVGALPGSKSAAAAAGLIEAWAGRFKDWHTDAMSHHDAVLKCAEYYEAEDQKAAREAEEFRRQIGLPSPAATPIQPLPTPPWGQ